MLDLRGNELSGSIPASLSLLSLLTTLILSKIELQGTIPPSLSVLTALTDLDVYNNDLT